MLHETILDYQRVFAGDPVHRGEKLLWAEMRPRVPMAVPAPSHAERLRLVDLLHPIDSAVARNATHAF
ncbi:MAG: hypothetical protein A2V98_09030 [Planctomycetes bacterium RBG_16_64_12]|nr:MAG: hypothetical protein A2V98_09030 [Planctomycetes bacterium RBG_16_64_12]